MIDWQTVIISALSIILTGGGLASIFFFRENKQAKRLENEATASEQWQALYEKSEEKVDSLNQKIEELFKEKEYLRDRLNEATTQNARLELLKCAVLKCLDRKPPILTEK